MRLRRRVGGCLALGLLLAATLRGAPCAEDGDSPEAGSAPTRVSQRAGVVSLELSQAAQARLGLKLATVESLKLPATASAPASVVDIGPLLALRQECQQLALDLEATARREEQARAQARRLAALRGIGAVVTPDQQQAVTVALEAVRGEREHTTARREACRDNLRYGWGEALTREALLPASSLPGDLITHRRQLLLVSPSPDARWPAVPGAAEYPSPDDAAAMIPVQILGPAPGTGGAVGASWFGLAADPALRLGSRVSVQLREGPMLVAARVPQTALLWHAGQQWLYVKREATRFERLPASQVRALDAGTSAVADLAAGSEVVAEGAQSLLGEELRWAIPTEGDD